MTAATISLIEYDILGAVEYRGLVTFPQLFKAVQPVSREDCVSLFRGIHLGGLVRYSGQRRRNRKLYHLTDRGRAVLAELRMPM